MLAKRKYDPRSNQARDRMGSMAGTGNLLTILL